MALGDGPQRVKQLNRALVGSDAAEVLLGVWRLEVWVPKRTWLGAAWLGVAKG